MSNSSLIPHSDCIPVNYPRASSSGAVRFFTTLGVEVIAEYASSHGKISLTVKLADRVWLTEFKVIKCDVSQQAPAQIKARGHARKYTGQLAILIGVALGGRGA